MKGYIKTHNTLFTLSKMEQLTHAGFDVVTPVRWKSLVAHVLTKTEDHYWEVDGLQLDLVEEFIISTEGDSESELESEDDLSLDDSEDSDWALHSVLQYWSSIVVVKQPTGYTMLVDGLGTAACEHILCVHVSNFLYVYIILWLNFFF